MTPAAPDMQEPLIENPNSSPQVEDVASRLKKRKRGGGPEAETAKTMGKNLPLKKARTDGHEDLGLENGINHVISDMDSELLADYVAQRTRKFETQLSHVELEDKYIPGT